MEQINTTLIRAWNSFCKAEYKEDYLIKPATPENIDDIMRYMRPSEIFQRGLNCQPKVEYLDFKHNPFALFIAQDFEGEPVIMGDREEVVRYIECLTEKELYQKFENIHKGGF